MLVDDEHDNNLIFTIGLQDAGFEVDSYNDPEMALAAFKSDYYDLVLLDIKMPKMDGFELYNEIRKIDDKVKVCFITAFDIQQKEHIECLIRKPIHIGDLVKRVRAEMLN